MKANNNRKRRGRIEDLPHLLIIPTSKKEESKLFFEAVFEDLDHVFFGNFLVSTAKEGCSGYTV